MRTVAVLLAAGKSERFGLDKLQVRLGGHTVWERAFTALREHPLIEAVGVVASDGLLSACTSNAAGALFVEKGGASRTESARIGFGRVPDWAEAVLFHDAARPFVSHRVIESVVRAVESHGAAFPAVPVADTVKERSDDGFRTLDRSRLVAVQTPQGARVEHFRRAFASGAEATDDAALLEAVGVPSVAVEGDPANIKLTRQEDLALLQAEVRTGMGYDVHRVSDDPARQMWLGGVLFPGPGLEGHSDADAVLHAIVDALLGAAGLGDIGDHYPNTDPRWKGEPSSTFLKETAQKLAAEGWNVVNIDVSVIAEKPKLSERRTEVRSAIAGLVGIGTERVSVKATTNEGLGSIGRGEGIAAYAVATIKRYS